MTEETSGRRGLSRRGFIGAAAGTAAAAGAATVGLRPGAFADSDPTANDATTPKWRIGIQMYVCRGNTSIGTTNATNTRKWLKRVVHHYGFVAVESHGNINQSNDWRGLTREQWREEVESHGGYVWGHHFGTALGTGTGAATPNATPINQALGFMHVMNSPTVGTASAGVAGWSGTYNVNQALNSAQRMDNFTTWLRQGDALAGVTQPGIDGARWYQHPHQNEYALITASNNSGFDEHNGRRLMEVCLDDADPDLGRLQCDLAWARHNVAMSPAAGSLYIDFLTHYEPQTFSYHVKGQTGTAEADCNLPDGSVNYRLGTPLSGFAGDTVPWADIFDTMATPHEKTFCWERDGANEAGGGTPVWQSPDYPDEDPTTWPDPQTTTVPQLLRSFDRFATLMHHAQYDRSAIGAPANVTPPQIFGAAGVNKKLRVQGDDRGEWVRHPQKHFEFQWLRNGTQPIEGANGNTYLTTSADAGWDIVCEVRARNSNGTTGEPTAPVSIPGGGPENTVAPSLSGSGAIGTMIDCDRGEWTGSGPYAYQWRANGAPVATGTGPGQTGSTNPARFRSQAAFSGQSVTCDVTRTDPTGSTTVPTSNSIVIA